jgi:hypothetical protein
LKTPSAPGYVDELASEGEAGGPIKKNIIFETGQVRGAFPDELFASDPGLDFFWDGAEVFRIGVVLWGVSPAQLFSLR